jgi:hypothetical protein
MALRMSSLSAQRNRIRLGSAPGRGGVWQTTYLGTNRNIRGAPGRTAEEDRIPEAHELYPMAYLVEQDADTETKAHFHQADQFQVVTAGNGWLGTEPLGTLAVHFATAYTPYGPIIAGHAGVHYLTLRNGWDPGAQPMPDERARLRTVKRCPRHIVSDVVFTLAPQMLAAARELSQVELIAPQPDGLEVRLYRIPRGMGVSGQAPRSGGGQFWIVISGSLNNREAEPFEALSCVFVFPDEEPFEARAGEKGLEILCLQFPVRTIH